MPDIFPPCTNACPVHTDVRGYLAAIARRDYREAYRLICANNPFPSVCAWVCPHPCEDACRRAAVDAPVAIRDLKRFAVDAAGEFPLEVSRAPASGRKVAVVGAGPAGLTAAHDLSRQGHRAVVYDRCPSPGGHFLTSVPLYRLPREMLRRDVEQILAAGVEVRTGIEVGRDVTIRELKEKYDAVIISAGLRAGRRLDLPGFDHPGVLGVLPFLEKFNRGEKPAVGKKVIVIGGGDVAMDAARTALRLGAPEVAAVCLEPGERMPAHSREIGEALSEGVRLLPGRGPVELLVERGGIAGLVVRRVKEFKEGCGPDSHLYDHERLEVIPGDTVILAIGQLPEERILKESGLTAPGGGRPAPGRDLFAPGSPGVFVCGELVTGPGPGIAAVASGHRAAAAAGRFLSGESVLSNGAEAQVIGPLPADVAEKIPRLQRQVMPVLSPGERKKNFLPYELGLSEAAALREAGRCLSCGAGANVQPDKCTACLACLRVCPYGVPVVGGHAVIPLEGCQACGICAASCPAGAIKISFPDPGAVRRKLALLSEEQNRVVFACREACLDGSVFENSKKAPGTGRPLVIELPTSDALRLEWILEAFEAGAAEVAVLACEPGRRRYAGDGAALDGLMARAKEILAEAGFSPQQLYCVRRHSWSS